MTKIPHLKLIVDAILKNNDGSTHFGLTRDPGETICVNCNTDAEAIKMLTAPPWFCFVCYRLDGDKPILIYPKP